MPRRPIEASVETSSAEPENGERSELSADAFKDALARWASGVSIVAVRDPDGDIHATTVGAFGAVSAEPPRVFFSLGPGAQALPFIQPGVSFAVNVLSSRQRKLASAYADAFAVGPSPFPEVGLPAIADALVTLSCRAEEVVPVGNSRIVVARVGDARHAPEGHPLIYFCRAYRRLADP